MVAYLELKLLALLISGVKSRDFCLKNQFNYKMTSESRPQVNGNATIRYLLVDPTILI